MEIAAFILAAGALVLGVVLACLVGDKFQDHEGRLNVVARNVEAVDDNLDGIKEDIGEELADIRDHARKQDMKMDVLDFKLHHPDSRYAIATRYTLACPILNVAYLSADHRRVCGDHINIVVPNFTVEKNVKINGDYIELYDDEGKLYEVYTVDKRDELTKLSDIEMYKNAKVFKENEVQGKKPVRPVKEDCIRHNIEQIIDDELSRFALTSSERDGVCNTLTRYVKGEIEDATNTL